jgi:hypothetical protein
MVVLSAALSNTPFCANFFSCGDQIFDSRQFKGEWLYCGFQFEGIQLTMPGKAWQQAYEADHIASANGK